MPSPPLRLPPAIAPAVLTLDLSLAVVLEPVDIGASLTRPAQVERWGTSLGAAWLPELPRVVSLRMAPRRVQTTGYRFVAGDAPPAVAAPPAGGPTPPPTVASGAPTVVSSACRPTRLKPPVDVIKLHDRLFYLLQPPLQWQLADQQLAMPFRPFPFQLEGVAFLYVRQAAVLADEMGLGKAMQAITALRLLIRGGEIGNVLLVCPKPLVSNWRREFAQWAPELPVAAIEGDQARRRWLWHLPGVPVKLANYELLLRDREALEVGAAFDLVVLDEAQRIKNRAGATAQVVCGIHRRRSWALTGTPVENSSEDLVGIFEFLAPGLLAADARPRQLGRQTRDYVLRRTKDQVLSDLPPKLFRDAELELSAAQRESYRLAEEQGVLRLRGLGREITIQHVFELILRLKQICNFDPATGESAKLERLQADLEEVAASGRKAIVFSQWVGAIEELARRLVRYRPAQYHGRMTMAAREQAIARFRDDRACRLILMSYGAGGVGLNLQWAGYVFLFDRWWNPAVEDQAINRAHRIGSTGPVTVSRMLCLNTIEERINQVLEEKRELFDTIFSQAAAPRRVGLTQQDVFGLFQLTCPGGPVDRAA
jgi:SNF2 family DNA or RNA helicase